MSERRDMHGDVKRLKAELAKCKEQKQNLFDRVHAIIDAEPNNPVSKKIHGVLFGRG